MTPTSLPRSYLYVPGNAEDKLAKALGRGADALIVDLEDAVPLAQKDRARDAVAAWIRGLVDPAAEIWVRINSGDAGHADVDALAGLPALAGLVLAKVEDAAHVVAVHERLLSLGDDRLLLMPLLETAGAILDAAAIARAPRVHRLQIGEVDLAGETGLEPGDDEAELAPIRTLVLLAGNAAGLHPPVGPVSRITADLDAFAVSTRRVRRQGFVGRACIHPAQLAVVHEVFTPTDAEVAEARAVLQLFEQAGDRGVVLDDRGRLIDLAVLRGARKVLALAARAS